MLFHPVYILASLPRPAHLLVQCRFRPEIENTGKQDFAKKGGWFAIFNLVHPKMISNFCLERFVSTCWVKGYNDTRNQFYGLPIIISRVSFSDTFYVWCYHKFPFLVPEQATSSVTCVNSSCGYPNPNFP
jgi:hypothetical protein